MISLPNSIKQNKVNDNYTIFEIEPFYPGYGTTIGNALRRVLLSSLEGAAVSEIKIKNAPHEFSTLPGVKEDVLHILLNLKKLRFKSHSEEPITITLSVKGEKVVLGKDFDLPSEVTLANKDEHIATLTDKKAELEIEVLIEKGFGYQFLLNEKDKKEAGVMTLDKIFTPIKKVNFKVEDIRVGDKTDFDKLFLEVETDGTIEPEEALLKSIEILTNHFNFLETDLSGNKVSTKTKKTAKKTVAELKQKITETALSEKTMNVLTENKIKTVADLTKNTEEKIESFKGIGKKGIKEINKLLEGLGLSFKKKYE